MGRIFGTHKLGRALVPSPFLASAVLATDALLALDDVAASTELLPKLAAGGLVGTVAVAEGGGVWDRDVGATTATERGGRWEIDGTKTPVLAGDSADLVLIYAPHVRRAGLVRRRGRRDRRYPHRVDRP